MYCLSWLFPLAGGQGSPDKAQIPEPTGLQLVTSITHAAQGQLPGTSVQFTLGSESTPMFF